MPDFVVDMVRQATRDDPQVTFEGVGMTLTMRLSGTGGIVDILLETMEKYAKQLEDRVKKWEDYYY